MKTYYFTLLILLFQMAADAQSNKAIFLHHSTGGAVYSEGNVAQWVTSHNAQNSTDYSITEFAYPNDPWGWENYPYDFWKLWVNGSCNNTLDNIQCLDRLCQNYELIIFKHCFPGAGIGEDSGSGDVTSSNKTIPNYQLQYRALLGLFDQYPNNKFMVWTLAPLHRLATSTEQAQRAAQFVHWVKNTWLTEDGKNHPNVSIFDFFGLAAEQSSSPASGVQYCLKYDYEGDHNGSDSHPNTTANVTIGPLFAQQVVNTLADNASTISKTNTASGLQLHYNALTRSIIYTIAGQTGTGPFLIEVFSISGQRIKVIESSENTGSIALEQNCGVFIVRVQTGKTNFSQKIAL